MSGDIFLLASLRNSLDIFRMLITALITGIVLLGFVLKESVSRVTLVVSLIIKHLTHRLLSVLINKNEHLLLGNEQHDDLVREQSDSSQNSEQIKNSHPLF